jgi:Replication initiation factor
VQVRFGIDWISSTFPVDAGKNFTTIGLIGQAVETARKYAKNGYTAGSVYSSGVIAMWSPNNAEMGVHVVFSGKALRGLQAQGIYPNEVLEAIAKYDGRVSRIDLAIDLTDSGLTPKELGTPQQPGEHIGRALKHTLVSGHDGSWTQYVGSRKSDKFLRIYDKAKEQRTPLLDIIRIEIEIKGKTAHAIGAKFARIDAAKGYSLMVGMLEKMVEFDCQVWRSLFQYEKPSIFAIPKSKDRDTVAWLLTTCAGALAVKILETGDETLMLQFEESVRYQIAQRAHKKEISEHMPTLLTSEIKPYARGRDSARKKAGTRKQKKSIV